MSGSLTVRAVVELYLRHAAIEGTHSEDARKDRERVFAAFVAALGSTEVATLKPFHLTDFVEAHPRWKSVSTRRAKANYIRAAFRWAAEQGRIVANPFVVVRYPEAERRPDFPDDTLERVCQLGNKPFERALRWLRLTLCRLSELCQAQWPDVDLEKGIWTIHKHKSRKSTGKAKLVALVPEAVALLHLVHLEARTFTVITPTVGLVGSEAMPAQTHGTIFLNNRGKPWTRRTLGQQLRRMKKRFGITTKASLHGVRHRGATAAIAAGASIKLVAAQLGHSTVQVTERYYVHDEHLIEGMREAARLGLPPKK